PRRRRAARRRGGAGDRARGKCNSDALLGLSGAAPVESCRRVPEEAPNLPGVNCMRTSKLPLALALLAFVAAPVLAQDSGTLKKVKDSGTITIGFRDASIPFSYLNAQQQPIGYAMDVCQHIVDAVKTKLNMPNLKVALNPLTSSARIPLMANGTIDLECGSTTNNAERKKQVDFGMTYFVVKYRFVTKKSSGMDKIDDLKGKTVVSTAGTTDINALNKLNTEKNFGMNVLAAKDHPEAF